MLKRLKVNNFKCLDGFDLQLDDHALLMGLNGSGKSTVVDVLRRLRRVLVGGESVATWFPTGTRSHHGSPNAQTFELAFESSGRSFNVLLDLGFGLAAHDAVRVVAERIEAGPARYERRLGEPAQVVFGPGNPRNGSMLLPDVLSGLPLLAGSDEVEGGFKAALAALASIRSYQLSPTAQTSRAAADPGELEEDGSNLPGFLVARQLASPLAVAGIVARFSRSVPSCWALHFTPVGDQFEVSARFRSPDGTQVRTYRYTQLSDGQRLLLMLAALAESVGTGEATFVLDEPDNYVALTEIQPLLQDLIEQDGIQLVITSHHPEVIDLLAKDYGYVMSRESEVGPAACRRWKAAAGTLLTPSELVRRGDIDGGA